MFDMRILAIIPACEGSSEMPNKNARVIGGKPLIYYVINNALTSKFITDVVVTSNSETILSIAKQMGTMIRRRDKELSNKDVALEPVIWDVAEQLEMSRYDYVITMQSITPTLKVHTLDDAIEQCIAENWDTVVSVTNKAHFYWKGVHNSPIPFFESRISRHHLPPFYVETGAFLITKTVFVNESSRFGSKVKLYELTGDEAVDIYTFGDLILVDNILGRKSICVYVNGNNRIGLGHVYRVMELADEFFTKPDIYYDINQTNRAVFGDTTHNLVPVDGVDGLLAVLRKIKYDCFINDVLSTDIEYMRTLRSALHNTKIVNLEDEGEGLTLADLVINDIYEESTHSNVCAGHKYFLASKLFLLTKPIEINKNVKSVLIAFGAADPQNYTERLLTIIPQYPKIRFIVVIGRAKKNAKDLMKDYSSIPNAEILYDVTSMPEIMSRCDAAVTSRGRTGFELAILGVPSISIAQHYRESLHVFLGEKNGFNYLGINPGDRIIAKALSELINMSQSERTELQQKMLSNDLRNGRKHILSLIESL